MPPSSASTSSFFLVAVFGVCLGAWPATAAKPGQAEPPPINLCRLSPDLAADNGQEWSALIAALRRRIPEYLKAHPEATLQQLAAGTTLELWQRFPREMDWFNQDNRPSRKDAGEVSEDFLALTGTTSTDPVLETRLIAAVLAELPAAVAASARRAVETLTAARAPAGDPRWLTLYRGLCELRAAERLRPLKTGVASQVIFIKRHPVKPSFFGYTEGQSDAQRERHFLPGSALCRLDLSGAKPVEETLLADQTGSLRDVDVSWDGTRLLFAWKKSLDDDDYHLYEMTLADRKIRQLTAGKNVADYEGRYLPNDEIVFSSTRCVQTVDCWWTEVSNLYTCDKDGQFIRRLGYDQVHTIYPAVLDNGLVLYTRWEYNDRGQVFPQSLFQMRPDGTNQTEYYGNNSWFPTVTSHARGIPGSHKVLAVLMGHHTWQAGKLALIDRTKGTQENSGVQLVAPLQDTPAVRVDAYGQDAELFAYPWPLSERECLVAMTPNRHARKQNWNFNLYWVSLAEGKRELLLADPTISIAHPIVLAPRQRPPVLPSAIDLRQREGTFYVQDVYSGPGLKNIPAGAAKTLRVVALEHRAAGVGNNGNGGEAGGAMVSTPISIGNGSWDVKRILGDAEIYADGSAFFKAPANLPVYFQILDEHGSMIQTMRSWSTLMPGENNACVGCHEDKNATPIHSKSASLALQQGAQTLTPFYGPPRGFSFTREIQPILDRHCVKCHREPMQNKVPGAVNCGSLAATPVPDHQAKRYWSAAYLTLTGSVPRQKNGEARANSGRPLVNWIDTQSRPSMLPPYHKGSAESTLMRMLCGGHGKCQLSQEELHKLAAWIDLAVPFCGDYMEANAWDDPETAKYLHFQRKREALAAQELRDQERLIERQTGTKVTLPTPAPLYPEYEHQPATPTPGAAPAGHPEGGQVHARVPWAMDLRPFRVPGQAEGVRQKAESDVP